MLWWISMFQFYTVQTAFNSMFCESSSSTYLSDESNAACQKYQDVLLHSIYKLQCHSKGINVSDIIYLCFIILHDKSLPFWTETCRLFRSTVHVQSNSLLYSHEWFIETKYSPLSSNCTALFSPCRKKVLSDPANRHSPDPLTPNTPC